MMSNRSLLGVSCAALLIFTAPSVAQVTPEQVWQSWQDMSAASGQAISADSVTRDGDSLIVTGLQMNVEQQGANAEGRLSELRFTDAGDGTVDITLPPNYPITMKLSDRPRQLKPIEISMEITQENMTLTASGDPTAVKYDMSAPSLTIKLTRIDGLAAQSQVVTGEATLSNIEGSYSVTDTSELRSDFTVGAVALALLGADFENELRMTAALKNLTMISEATMIGAVGSPSFEETLRNGASSSSNFTVGSSDFDLEAVDRDGVTSVKGTLDGQSFRRSLMFKGWIMR